MFAETSFFAVHNKKMMLLLSQITFSDSLMINTLHMHWSLVTRVSILFSRHLHCVIYKAISALINPR